jgi:hypothetical protein
MLKLQQAERRLFRSAGLAGSGGNCRVVRRTALWSFLTFCFLLCQDKRKSCRRQKGLRRHAFLFRGKRKGGKKTLNHRLKHMAMLDTLNPKGSNNYNLKCINVFIRPLRGRTFLFTDDFYSDSIPSGLWFCKNSKIQFLFPLVKTHDYPFFIINSSLFIIPYFYLHHFYWF